MQSCSEHMRALVSVLPLQTTSGHSEPSFIQRQLFQTYWVHTYIRKTGEDSTRKAYYLIWKKSIPSTQAILGKRNLHKRVVLYIPTS